MKRVKLNKQTEYSPVLVVEDGYIGLEKYFPDDQTTETIQLFHEEGKELFEALKHVYDEYEVFLDKLDPLQEEDS